eukprot:gene4271-14382_t
MAAPELDDGMAAQRLDDGVSALRRTSNGTSTNTNTNTNTKNNTITNIFSPHTQMAAQRLDDNMAAQRLDDGVKAAFAAASSTMAAQSLDDGVNALQRTSKGTSTTTKTNTNTYTFVTHRWQPRVWMMMAAQSLDDGENALRRTSNGRTSGAPPTSDRTSNSRSAGERGTPVGDRSSNTYKRRYHGIQGAGSLAHTPPRKGLASALTKADFQVTSILDPDGIGPEAGDLDLLLAKLCTKGGVRFTIIITDAIHSNQTEAASARAAATGDYPNLSASLNASLPSPRLRRMSEQKDVDGGDSIAPAPPARASASGASPPSRASTSGMSAKSSLTGTLGSTVACPPKAPWRGPLGAQSSLAGTLGSTGGLEQSELCKQINSPPVPPHKWRVRQKLLGGDPWEHRAPNGDPREYRASASGVSPPSRASTSGMSAKSSLTGTLGSTVALQSPQELLGGDPREHSVRKWRFSPLKSVHKWHVRQKLLDGDPWKYRGSDISPAPPTKASASGVFSRSSLTETLGSTERKSRTSPGGTKTLGPKSRATQTLVWSGAGLAASLVIDSSSTGSESRGPEKGCRHSLFMECILRYSFIKNHIFKKSLNSVISTVRDHSKGAQIPYLNDTAELPSDWRMVEE